MSDLTIPRDNPNDDEVLITFVAASGKQEKGAILVSYETTKTQMDIVADKDGFFQPSVTAGNVVGVNSVCGSYLDDLDENFTLRSEGQNSEEANGSDSNSHDFRFLSKRAKEFIGQTNARYSGDLTFVCRNDLDSNSAVSKPIYRPPYGDQIEGVPYPNIGLNNGGCYLSSLEFEVELHQRISKLKLGALNNVYLDAFLHSAMTAFFESNLERKAELGWNGKKVDFLVGFISRKNDLLVPYAITDKRVSDGMLASIQDGLLSILKGEGAPYFRRQGAFIMFTDLTSYECISMSPLLYSDNYIMVGVTKVGSLHRFSVTFDHRLFDAVDICDFFSAFEEHVLRFFADV